MSAPIGPGRLILVVGPSGAGKDTVIAGAREALAGDPATVFARRIVTRPATAAEDHDTLDEAAFDRAMAAGAFAFYWQAHGLKYAIPRSAVDDIRKGHVVVCNVSRGIVADLRERYAHVVVVLVTAPPEVLARRLAERSRESDGPLAARERRSDQYAGFAADHVIENTATADEAATRLAQVIRGATA